jgi:hypothetical protein
MTIEDFETMLIDLEKVGTDLKIQVKDFVRELKSSTKSTISQTEFISLLPRIIDETDLTQVSCLLKQKEQDLMSSL